MKRLNFADAKGEQALLFYLLSFIFALLGAESKRLREALTQAFFYIYLMGRTIYKRKATSKILSFQSK